MTEDEFTVRLSGVHDVEGARLLMDEVEEMRAVAFQYEDDNRLPTYATYQARVAERRAAIASGSVEVPAEIPGETEEGEHGDDS